MLLPFEINVPTLVVLALIVAWAVWAVRRLTGRGLCDCGDHCGDGTGTACSHGSCSGCSAAEKMVADMDKSSKGACSRRARG